MTNPLRCAWCKRIIGTTTAEHGSDGICADCRVRFYTDNGLWPAVFKRLLAGKNPAGMMAGIREE